MRYFFFLALALFALSGCTSSKNSSSTTPGIQTYSPGMFPVLDDNENSFSEIREGIVKIMKNNSGIGTGVFVSESGLVLAPYETIVGVLAGKSSTGENLFVNGFNSGPNALEIPLPGISLLILTEQRDVTDIIQEKVTSNSRNYEIAQAVSAAKQELTNELTAGNPDILVEISDLYSGNSQLLSVYQIIRDVRLVFAPRTDITADNIANSESLYQAISGEYAFLRAYSETKTPFIPAHFFGIADLPKNNATQVTAIGYPGQTFRHEGSDAIHFFHTQTNPYVLGSYKLFQAKEDSLAALSTEYAFASLENRYQIAKNVVSYTAFQNSIVEQEIIARKKSIEAEFQTWAEEDSLRNIRHGEILFRMEQVYEMGEQTGDIFYITNYYQNLSLLDDLSKVFSGYMEFTLQEHPDSVLFKTQNDILNYQHQLVPQININAELEMLAGVLEMMKQVPEERQPLLTFDLFYDAPKTELPGMLREFTLRQAHSSFLFDAEKTIRVFESGDFYADSLFSLMDELTTTYNTARENLVRYYMYRNPTQQYYERSFSEWGFPDFNYPDANGTMRYNEGSLNLSLSQPGTDYFYTTNDFAGGASGSAIINESGDLLGIISNEITDAVSGNYIYSGQAATAKALSVSAILKELEAQKAPAILMEELRKN